MPKYIEISVVLQYSFYHKSVKYGSKFDYFLAKTYKKRCLLLSVCRINIEI